jgi:hypothetical protein
MVGGIEPFEPVEEQLERGGHASDARRQQGRGPHLSGRLEAVRREQRPRLPRIFMAVRREQLRWDYQVPYSASADFTDYGANVHIADPLSRTAAGESATASGTLPLTGPPPRAYVF